MLTRIILLLALTFLGFGQFNRKKSIHRIVEGHFVNITERPFQVLILIPEGRSNVDYCGGSIISQTKILTAAHCLIIRPPALIVKVGTENLVGGGQIYFAKSYVNHPKFNELADYDVSVITLREPLQFNERVSCIRMADSVPRGGEKAIVSGWGYFEYSGTNGSNTTTIIMSEKLRAVEVQMFDENYCKEKEDAGNFMYTDRMVCAGDLEIGKDHCRGDSGGPLTVNGELVGVVSGSISCGDSKYPGIYANVANIEIRKFIMTHLSR